MHLEDLLQLLMQICVSSDMWTLNAEWNEEDLYQFWPKVWSSVEQLVTEYIPSEFSICALMKKLSFGTVTGMAMNLLRIVC